MAGIVVITNFESIAAKLMSMALAVPGVANRVMHMHADAMGEILVEETRAVTPVFSGTLRDSTTYRTTGAGLDLRIDAVQGATNAEGVPYVEYVVDGRGVVVPVTASVLANDAANFGPVMRAGPTKPNDYPSQAVENARPRLEDEMTITGREIGSAIVRLLR